MRPGTVKRLVRWFAATASIVALAAATTAAADPPSRVARLAYAEGNVSFSPAGDDEWVRAALNRPLVAGDRLWSDAGSRAELSMTNASARFGPLTSITLLNLDDRTQQLQLTQGVLHLQVRRLAAGEIVEIDTPNFAFSVTRPGSFRFEVDPQGGGSLIVVRSGEGEAYGEGAAYRIGAGQAYRFYGTDLRDQEYVALPAPDGFERWSLGRERRFERAMASRYVAPEVIGYEDLDAHGTWQAVADYGNVWIPRSVPAGWAPYRNGHWSWIDPWGWTWIDDAPWGFAPFHYGRWALAQDRWCWVPGPVRTRPVYAPALVAFVGGSNFSVSVSSGSAIGWFPLGPGEVYRPAYNVSRDYFTRVNVANTIVNNTYVTNIYNQRDTARLRYANMQRPAAITAVSQTAFVQAQPVQRSVLRVTSQVLDKAEVLPLAKIAPQRASFMGAAHAANATPPRAALERQVVAKAPPAPASAPIATKLPMLNAAPGKPMDRPTPQATPGGPAGSATAPTHNVRVVNAAEPKPAPRTSMPTDNRSRRDASTAPDTTRATAPTAPAINSAPPAGPPPQSRAGEPRRDAPPVQERPGRTAQAEDKQRARGNAPGNADRAPDAAPPAAPPPQAQQQRAPEPVQTRPEARTVPQPAPAPEQRAMPQPPPQQRAQEQPRGRADPRTMPQAPPEQRAMPQPPPQQRAQEQPRERADPRATPQAPPEQRATPQPPPQQRAMPQPAPEQRATPQPPPQQRAMPQPAPEQRTMPQPPPQQRAQEQARGRAEPRATPQAPPQPTAQPAPPAAAPAAPPSQAQGSARGNEGRDNKGGGKRDGNDNDKKP
jgi:hypothetical protein